MTPKLIKKEAQQYLNKFSWGKLIAFIFYPVFTSFTTPVRLLQTLWNCRTLADGKDWGKYPNFQVHKSLNYLFYWTVALGLNRHGRFGVCPNMGVGNYKLARLFHYSLPSLYAYWRMGAVSILFGMFGWLAIHFIWFQESSLVWCVSVVGLTLVSTTFYANAFGHQNYNVFGWLFFPIFIYGMIKNNLSLQTFSLLAASFGSYTVVFVCFILIFAEAVQGISIVPILVALPAMIKLSTHFIPLFDKSGIKEAIVYITKAVGMTKSNTKYLRNKANINLNLIYFTFIYGQFLLIYYMLTHEFSVIYFSGIIIMIVNQTCARFADRQSMQMLFLTITTALTLERQDFRILPFFWIAVSPLPMFLGFPSMKKVFSIVPKLAPYSIENLKTNMEDFLESVGSGKRVLMAFDDPEGDYNKIFDGYRVLLQLILYVSMTKGIHFIPDYQAVFEINYEGAPNFWGRDLSSVLNNARIWKADFVVIYQKAGAKFSKDWEKAGFRVLNTFSWAEEERELEGIRPYSGFIPEWWLMAVPESLKK